MAEKRKTNQLLALGSAAVIAVYAAGYTRTRAVALRLAEEEHRRPVMPAPPEAGPAPTMPEPPPVVAVVPTQLKRSHADEFRSPRNEQNHEQRHERASNELAASASMSPTHHADVATPPVTTDVALPATTIEQKPLEVPPPPPTPPPPAKPSLKDGTYYGWGTSRHGDIQARVIIEDGRIKNAAIAQCLTRYSCSWIAPLVPQVVQRQSAEVDYVSGATQSTYAFYYAVLEALSKAK